MKSLTKGTVSNPYGCSWYHREPFQFHWGKLCLSGEIVRHGGAANFLNLRKLFQSGLKTGRQEALTFYKDSIVYREAYFAVNTSYFANEGAFKGSGVGISLG